MKYFAITLTRRDFNSENYIGTFKVPIYEMENKRQHGVWVPKKDNPKRKDLSIKEWLRRFPEIEKPSTDFKTQEMGDGWASLLLEIREL